MCTLWSSDIGSLIAFLSFYYIKFHSLAISHTPQILPGVILGDGGLVNEHIFLGVISVYEAISALNVEPLHCTRDLCG